MIRIAEATTNPGPSPGKSVAFYCYLLPSTDVHSTSCYAAKALVVPGYNLTGILHQQYSFGCFFFFLLVLSHSVEASHRHQIPHAVLGNP